jgi:hypothetical protein
MVDQDREGDYFQIAHSLRMSGKRRAAGGKAHDKRGSRPVESLIMVKAAASGVFVRRRVE